jgi:uncharacterized delta-60 repeat protein
MQRLTVMVSPSPPHTFAEATAILVQSDTKIVVAGTSKALSTEDFALLRYNSDGSLDAGFGTGGKQTIDFNRGGDQLRAAVLTSDGILVTGLTDPAGNKLRKIALARYGPTGHLDAAFNDDGKTAQYFSAGSTGYNGMAVQKNGKLLAVGYTVSNLLL